MIRFLISLIVNSPVYPHWLEFLKARIGTDKILHGINGTVLEVGAGDGSRKIELLSKYPSIKKYVSTDYSSWDKEFDEIDTRVSKSVFLEEFFRGRKKRNPLDEVCSATKLPFEDNTFDYHISFEVLEHIDDPFKYFSEAARVLKPGGRAIVVVPFLYRMHGGEDVDHRKDYFRYAKGFFYALSEHSSFEVVEIFNNTGFGTTFASLLNQYLARNIMEGNIFLGSILLCISPIIFIFSNTIGFLVDIFPDQRFATRFHVILQKKR